MAQLVVSDQAALDATAIVAMLNDTAGADVAARYRRAIEVLFERLATFPRSGMRRPALGRLARIGVVAPYVVIYDYRPDNVTILRILDGVGTSLEDWYANDRVA